LLKRNALCAGLASILVSVPVFALSPPPMPDSDVDTRFEPVVVTSATQSSPLTFEIDPKTPRQPVPASDGADYLKTIPGFTAIRNGGTNGDPVLRGMFGSRLKLLTNDSELLGACPVRMDNPMSYVSPETYDRLVVIKGPETVIWGPGSSAGTVRFERDTERFDQAGWRGYGSLLAGSWGRNDQVVDVAGGAPNGYVRVTANRSEQGDYDDGDGNRVPSHWMKWNADIEAGWTPDADTRLVATIGTGDGEARYAGRSMDGSQFKRESGVLRFEKVRIGGVLDAVEASVFSNYADHVMDNYSLRDPDPNSSMPMPMASNVDRRTTGGRVAATWRWGESLSLVTGLDQQSNAHRARKGMGRDTYQSQPWVADARFTTAGAFAELTWKLSAHDRLITGARVDHATARDKRLTTTGMMPMPNPTMGVTRRDTLDSGFLRYERDLASSPTTLYAGLGHVERFPDFWELFSASSAPMGSVNAFSSVKPERTTQLDIGAQYNGETVRSWVSLYAGKVDDFILFRYSTGGMMGPSSQALNIQARTRGGELGSQWRFAEHWNADASIAYAWGENTSHSSALPQMPPLEGRLGINYDNHAWSFGGLWRLVARQNRVSINEGNVVGRDLGPSKGFGTLAFNAGYRWNESLQLTAGVDNLLDRTYAEHLNLGGNAAFGYPADPVRINEPGRTIWTKLNINFN
jgi:iron complex outermembrane recepter protein